MHPGKANDRLLVQEVSTSQPNSVPAVEPGPSRKPPRGRGPAAAAAAAAEGSAEDANQAQHQRRAGRRQPGTGTTSACADAVPTPAPKQALQPSKKCSADSDTIMEAVVKVSISV